VAEERHRWHEYQVVQLRQKIDRKKHRHTKRTDVGLEVDEAKFQQDLTGNKSWSPILGPTPSLTLGIALEECIQTVLAAPVDPNEAEPVLPVVDSSDDGLDEEEWEARMEGLARLKVRRLCCMHANWVLMG